MTEYELVDVLISYNTAAMSALALYLTTASGYLIAAYLAGANLTRSQAVFVSVLFIVFALFFGYGSVAYFSRGLVIADELRKMNPGEWYGLAAWLIVTVAGLCLVGIFASLKFMLDVRANAKKE